MADEKNISSLIQHQFPDVYREEGRVFVDFVTEYYKWMEQSTDRRNVLLNPQNATIDVVYGSANVTGTFTQFDTEFAAGDKISITRPNASLGQDADAEFDYEMFTVNAVTNSTFLILESAKLPNFGISNATYGNVASKANPGYYTRRTTDIVDVDKTTSDFLVYFKETYLKNIQFNTVTDVRTVIKHSLDLYRSKGTPRSVDLLFRLAFGVPAEVYYPSTDLLRASTGQWILPRYLELSLRAENVNLVNRQLTGVQSGAIAFCDAMVRKQIKGRFIDVAYISAISGNFDTFEKIISTCGTCTIDVAPTIVGSLNSLAVAGGGTGFAIGDIIDFTSALGQQGKARVANTANAAGGVGLTLVDGGYGYTANATVYVSEKVLKVESVTPNTTNTFYFWDMEAVYQPTANIVYSTATGNLVIGADIYTYHANGSVDGTGAILDTTAVNSTYGELQLKMLSGDMNNVTFYTTSNTISATAVTYTDTTVSANVTGHYANVYLQVDSIAGTFVNTDIVTSPFGGNATFYELSNTAGSSGTILVVNATSSYQVADVITGSGSLATATISKIDVELGVHSTSPTTGFFTVANNYLYSNTLNVNGTVTSIPTGTGLTFAIANNLLYAETVNLSTTLLTANATHWMNVRLNATQYDMPGDTAGNLTSNTIANMLGYADVVLGKIQTLSSINSGNSYSKIPVVKVIDPFGYPYRYDDQYQISYANATVSFEAGELVTQDSTNFRGIIHTSNSTVILAQRLRWAVNSAPIVTTNSATTLVGENSGSIANVTATVFAANSLFLGNDINITLASVTGNGVISELDVTDSGFGFRDGEGATGSNGVTALVTTTTHGTGSGFYASKDGFLDDIKKVQDGDYWQTHSYEVKSTVPLDKYRDMLKDVIHVAGTVFFGNLVHTAVSNAQFGAVSNTGSNTVVSSSISLLSIKDRAGDFIYDYQANNIVTRV